MSNVFKPKKRGRKWNRTHEFSKRKPTKSTSGHPAYIYGKSGRQRKYLAFTHSETTNGAKNEKLAVNIDGTNEPCYLRIIPLYATVDKFEEPHKEYKLRSKYDEELIKKYKK